MPVYKPLPARLIQLMTAGIENELTPLAENRIMAIRRKPCPRCGSAMQPTMNTKHPFTPDDPLPRTLGRCTECELEWDPLTDIIIRPGNPAKIEDPYPIVKPDR
jgi:hypothetical protein